MIMANGSANPHLPDQDRLARFVPDSNRIGPQAGAYTAPRPLRLIHADDLRTVSDVPFGIDGLYSADGFIVLAGPPGCGKSFAAMHIGMCHATGTPCWGRDVRKGFVVYVAAEGRAGIRRRLDAWEEKHPLAGTPDLYMVTEPTPLASPLEVDRVLLAIQDLPQRPVLIVIDTLARSLAGADENSARDIGAFVAGVEALRSATGAATLVIHHSGHAGDRERGSTALRAATDTTMFMKPAKGDIVLECLKQKDAEPFAPLKFRLESAAESCVLVPVTGGVHQAGVSLSDAVRSALEVLLRHGAKGLTAADWQRSCGVGNSAFYRTVKCLVEAGLVVGGGRRGTPYLPTELANHIFADGSAQLPLL